MNISILDVPTSLLEKRNWVVWKTVLRHGRKTKLPLDAKMPRAARVDDESTWSTFSAARLAARKDPYLCVGYMFKKGEGIFGIDFDSVIDRNGKIAPWISPFLDQFPTYWELSPSGTGLKLWALGDYSQTGLSVPLGLAMSNEKRCRVEVYGWGRYFAFTGRRLQTATPELGNCQDALVDLVKRLHVQVAKGKGVEVTMQPSDSPAKLSARGEAYIAKVPPTKCGRGSCHNGTFRVACVLTRYIGLDRAGAFALLRKWADRGEHVWTDKELAHKLDDAMKTDASQN